MHFHKILFKVDNFTFIVQTIMLVLVELGMSFGRN